VRKLLILLGLLWVLPALAQFPISKLPPATLPLSGAEIVPMTQAGATKQTAITNIFATSAPLSAAYLLEAPNALIPNSRTLVGTANEIILTDGGALGGLTLSTPQAIGTASNVTFASVILGTPLTAPNGGTGLASYTIGDLLTAASSTSLTQLSDVATGSYLRSKGVATAPGWSVVTLPNLDTLGDIWYASAANTMTALSGNTTATKNFLTQTGNGSVSAAPAWSLLALTDVPPINLGATTNGGVLSTSQLPVAQGGTGLATLPAHTVLLGEAAANVGNVAAMALDTVLQGRGATTDPAAVNINNCSAVNQGLSYSTSSHVFGCNTVASANPTATVGLTAVNGTATTFMTSDSAPPLSQSISPTMTGTWVFSNSVALNGGFLGTSTANANFLNGLVNTNTGTSAKTQLKFEGVTSGNDLLIGFDNTNVGVTTFTGGVAPAGILGTNFSAAISIGTNGVERVRIGPTGGATIDTPTAAVTALQINSVSGSLNLGVTGASSDAARIQLTDGNAGARAYQIRDGGLATGTLDIFDSTGGASRLSITSAGAVSLPSLASSSAATTGTVCWTAGGNLTVDTTVACLASTRRIKQHIKPLISGLPTVMSLRPVSYNLKPEFNPQHLGPQVGLIAEEVQKVDARLIAVDDNGSPRGVRYMQLTAVLVKAIQEQQKEIDELKRRLPK